MIITIDGKIATGKSTIAKKLAREIGYIYFDTGAMYRAITYGILKENVDFHNPDALQNYLNNFKFDIKIVHGERRYFANGEDVTLQIRSPKVTSSVSAVSAVPSVREKLITLQRECAEGVNAVFEGRDMGTVVFPNAELKIFLTGDPEVRAARRFAELKEKFPEETSDLTVEKVLEEINARDASDMQREISPLKQADDACVVDTSSLTVDGVILKILELKDALKAHQKQQMQK